MSHCHGPSARIALGVGSWIASFALVAACSDAAPAEAFIGATGSLAWCGDHAGCGESTPPATVPEAAPVPEAAQPEATPPEATPPAAAQPDIAPQTDWLVRCTSDAECAIGQCVCGLCTGACAGDEAGACSGLPEGAACFAGGTTARAALCRASTVAGICLPPCNAGDDCGEGFICALGACLPRPSSD